MQINILGFLKKLGVILYKNLLLRRTQWFITTMELLLPFLSVALVCWKIPSFACISEGKGQIPEGGRETLYPQKQPCRVGVTLSYAPANAKTKEIVENVRKRCSQLIIQERANETTFEEALKDADGNEVGVIFPDDIEELLKGKVENKVIPYKIRMHANLSIPSTKKLLPIRKLGDPDFTGLSDGSNEKQAHVIKYMENNFLHLQHELDMVLIKMITGQDPTLEYDIGFEGIRYYYADTIVDPYGAVYGMSIVQILIAFSVLFVVPTITRNVVSEKQTGINELLKSTGVSGGIQWLGWLINSLVPFLFSSFICVLLLYTRLANKEDKLNYDSCDPEAYLFNSDWTLVWFILVLYILSTIALCFFICSLVKKPTIATTIVIIICVVSSFLNLLAGDQVALLVFPNCALAYAFITMGKLDAAVLDDSDQPYGAQWDWEGLNYAFPEGSTLYQASGVKIKDVYQVSLLQIIWMMVADIIVYSLLALYFENVLPSEHGVRRPWYLFNFAELFKSGGKKRHVQVAAQAPTVMEADVDKQESSKEEGAGEGTTVTDNASLGPAQSRQTMENREETLTVVNSSLEPEARKQDHRIGIELKNMYKRFGRKVAVNGVSLSMYTGDIFAMLGHNGAGKTTLISMISGFFSPTSGTAIVDGHDIRNDMAKAREHMGLCPQHNMIFENISVINQLIIFGMLRGKSSQVINQEAQFLLFKMNLIDKKNTLAKNLSGGQKRKLSLGMALIGGTKVVILDEPTSGMDPQARREIWDLLLELRGQRTILLTTHFMEEADVLGDRIGIMAAGKLQCCGTTAFLKKYYGTGLNLKLTLKQEPDPSAESKSEAPQEPKKMVENPNVPKIVALVKKHISGASLKRDTRSVENSSEVFLSLPAETATTAALTKMFTDLNGNKENLGIQTIGLQQTTMDEVFLRVGEIAEEEAGPIQKYVWTEEDNFAQAPKIFGVKKTVWQFVILLIKKWILFKRKWIILLLEATVPLLLILIAAIILQKSSEVPEKGNNKNNYGGPSPIYHNNSYKPRGPEPDPQPPLLISLEKYSSPISYYHSQIGATFNQSHIEAVLGPSAMKYNDTSIPFRDGLALVGKSDIKKYKRRLIIAVTAEESWNSVKTAIIVMLNTYPYHSAPLAINTATNIVLRAMDPSANNRIQVTSHPWVRPQIAKTSRSAELERDFDPDLNDQSRNYDYGNYNQIGDYCDMFFYSVQDVGPAILILVAFILFITTFIVGPIEEKITNVKQLQLMTGLHPVNYWLAHFVWDYTLYFLFVLVVLALVAIIELSGHLHLWVNYGGGALFLILMCYGFSCIALDYLLSLRSTTVAGGFALVTTIHLFTGVILGFAVLTLPNKKSGVYEFINLMMKILGYLFPSMPALFALVKYSARARENIKPCGEDWNQEKCCEYLRWSVYIDSKSDVEAPGPGQELFYVVLVGVIYVILIMLIEYKVLGKLCGRGAPPPFPPNIYDDDVYEEAERVNTLIQTGQVGTQCMVVQNLSKAFGGFAAVSLVNFDVHYGECFGLLGVNGAGKTTVFKMITGEVFPSQGSIFGFGTSTYEKPRYFFSNIGYCPQFDAILVVFTGREMLELFGVLRGLPYRVAKMDATKWLQRFGLIESADVRCGKYSGGMKRRLSTAMAMIGDPALLLLDEPTSGVDPVSRHQFWGVLEKIRDSGKSIILTSHSMDECEALCSRLGIMVNGQFQCFGGVQHLKSKFAQGYSLTIKLKPDMAFGTPEIDEKLTMFQEKINETFQPCSLKDKHENLLQYHLENPTITWDVLFKMLESVKKDFEDMIEDYSVNETSLEEVFLAFARSQYGERNVEVTTCGQICTCAF